jgi:hypothetical protein
MKIQFRENSQDRAQDGKIADNAIGATETPAQGLRT